MTNKQHAKASLNFEFPTYHPGEALDVSLAKLYDDPRAIAILYGCGTYPTTEHFKQAIEHVLEQHDYSTTITIDNLLEFQRLCHLIDGDDLSDLIGNDYPPYAQIDDYRLELCVYQNARSAVTNWNVDEVLMNRAYLKFITAAARLKQKHIEEVGLADLMADDKEHPDAEDFFGPDPEPTDEQIDYLYGTDSNN